MEIPTEWPNKIKELYEPIRILGKGGFASVVLARNKKNNKQQQQQQQQQQTKVAIKVVGCAANDNDDDNNSNAIQAVAAASLYAQREIEILKQIDHPNIVKLFNHWIAGVDDDDDDNNGDNTSSLITKTAAAVLVLEYVKGPTVESLLRYGGALSTIFGRIIIAQMMDAVSYLHYHAVLHRDIKPDNILVSGAISNDDTIWDNNPNNIANNSNNNNNNDDNNNDNDELDEKCHHHHSSYSSSGGTTTSTAKYRELLLKWKVTIIDFGFARALTPNDVEKPSQENRLKHSKNASYHDIYNINSSSNNNNNKSNNYTDELSSSSSRRLRQRISRGILNVLDVSFHRDINDLSSSQRSATHKIKRTMSTLGNR
jgi:serine/threonine protein kinase